MNIKTGNRILFLLQHFVTLAGLTCKQYKIIFAMVEIIVPVAVCVVLPVMVVWLVFWSRNHIVDRKAEVLLKAIENGQDIDPEMFASDDRSKRSLKMNLLGKLQTGIILLIMGAGLVACALNIPDKDSLFIIASILLALGIGFFVSFFVGRKWMETEIRAEENQALREQGKKTGSGQDHMSEQE